MKSSCKTIFTLLFIYIILAWGTKAYASTIIKQRIEGEDRYNTAIAISKSGWERSESIVLATGEDFPDALCAAPLANELNAPILIAEKLQLNNGLEEELYRLGVKHAYIIGGQGVISKDVEARLKEIDIKCTRLYGQDRYETSLSVASYLTVISSKKVEEIMAVTGEDFPDALSIAPIAARMGIPIILSPRSELLEITKKYINENGIKKAYVIGGIGAIGENVKRQLPDPERIYGNDRYETNIAIQDRFITNNLNFTTMYIATGQNFPDALAGSALAAKASSPIILADYGLVSVPKSFISKRLEFIKKLWVLGGEGALPSSVLNCLYPEIVSIDTINISLNKGEKFTLPQKVAAKMSDGTTSEVSVAWNPSSHDNGSQGVFDFLGTVADYDKKAELVLTVGVKPVRINTIKGIDDVFTMVSNKTLKLMPKALDDTENEIKNADFFYSSNKESIVRVDNSGLITAVSEGATIVNIKAKNSINEVNVSVIIIVNSKLDVTEIAKESGAVVYIEVYDGNHGLITMGSGFILSPEGIVVTNYHVIDEGYYATVTLENGTKYEAEGVLGYSVDKDLAVLKLKNAVSLKAVKPGNLQNLKIGSEVVAIGSPMGYKNTVSTGIISGFRDSEIRAGKDIQISAPISLGSSGGALFNMYGEAIGVTYAGTEGVGNINFAIPIDEVLPMMSSSSVKTLEYVCNQVHPKMSYEEFAKHIKENYSNTSINGKAIKIDNVSVSGGNESPEYIYVFLTVYRESHVSYLKSLVDDYDVARENIEQWMMAVGEETARQYPEKLVSGGIWYVDEYSIYPEAYPPLDITYDSNTMIWKVSHQELFFTNNTDDGEFTIMWR